jgi:hypothetical protein
MVVTIMIVGIMIVAMKSMDVTRVFIGMALSATEGHRIMTMIVTLDGLA